METNNGRITKSPDLLLEFHKRKLAETVEIDRLQTYHRERIDYLSSMATVHTIHTPLDQANVVFLDDYRGGEAA